MYIKKIVFSLLILYSIKFYSQEIKTTIFGKEWSVCTSLAYAECLDPSKVEGFSLLSKGYNDFPKEVFKFKNIKVFRFKR
jgi:hypothetical protein